MLSDNSLAQFSIVYSRSSTKSKFSGSNLHTGHTSQKHVMSLHRITLYPQKHLQFENRTPVVCSAERIVQCGKPCLIAIGAVRMVVHALLEILFAPNFRIRRPRL